MSNGKPSVLLILNKAPGANVIKTVDTIRSLLPQLQESISPAINVAVAMDRTPTIPASIREVQRTLAIAFGLVMNRLRGKLAHIPAAKLFLAPVQDIRMGARQANASWQYTLQADVVDDLRTWESNVRRALTAVPQITDVDSDQQDKGI